MPANIQPETNDICLLRLSGTLEQTEFARVQNTLATHINTGVKPRILAILENFAGWEPGDWGNLDFQYWYSNEIAKIAIVGDSRWEREALAFAGAGNRNAQVKFFAENQLAEAKTWLAE